ncbi:MAG: hypothetical protein ACQER7_06305 [Bacteroidota bacterium]
MGDCSKINYNPAIGLVLLLGMFFFGAVINNQQINPDEGLHKVKSAGSFNGYEEDPFNVVHQKTNAMETQQKQITTALIGRDGNFPNNDRFPVIIYEPDDLDLSGAKDFEKLFQRNNWKNSWRNGIFGMHHYHSITHEVLGIYQGEAKVQLGGPNGQTFTLKKGQAVVLPAGVSHKNLGSSADFACVGAYPGGSDWDMNYGKPEELDQALDNIAQVGIPDQDPLYGADGPLFEHWE